MSPAARCKVHPIGQGRFIVSDPRMMHWVASRIASIPAGYIWPSASAIGLANEREIIAGMVVHDFVPSTRSCQITFAADTPKWATRHSIRALLRYPFEQLNCRRLTTFIARSNVRSIRFNEGLGFQLEGVIRFGMGDEDALIYGLLKEECRLYFDGDAA